MPTTTVTNIHRYSGRVALALTIVLSPKDVDFIKAGDSGSVVLLNRETPGTSDDDNTATPHAAIVALGFASDSATMLSYGVPFDLVVKDIEKVTGADVKSPFFDGEAVGDATWNLAEK